MLDIKESSLAGSLSSSTSCHSILWTRSLLPSDYILTRFFLQTSLDEILSTDLEPESESAPYFVASHSPQQAQHPYLRLDEIGYVGIPFTHSEAARMLPQMAAQPTTPQGTLQEIWKLPAAQVRL